MIDKIMTFEEELEKYITALTPFEIVLVHIEDKNYGMIQEILTEYESIYQKVESDEAVLGLSLQICKMKRALRKLNSRTEEQEEADLLIWEDLQRAMHG